MPSRHFRFTEIPFNEPVHSPPRRRTLAALAVGAAGLIATRPLIAADGTARLCRVRPRQTEGPFFVDPVRERADLRLDAATGIAKAGVPLVLTFNVSRDAGGTCSPIAGAQVDVWHCDADGVYSGVRDYDADTRNAQFLRGWQRSDADGVARFTTIYPGWYAGRAPHIHFMVRTALGVRRGFTSQLYFDDATSDQVYRRPEYSRRSGRRMRNAEDGLFASGGRELVLALSPSGDGYAASFDLALVG
jgi:protocatechuate 3,4-dioxygenase beta subunit